MTSFTCKFCGIDFTPKDKKSKGVFCSRECVCKYRGKRLTDAKPIQACSHCGMKFKKRWNKNVGRYCSAACVRAGATARAISMPDDFGNCYHVDAVTGCWNWKKHKNKKGYGRFTKKRRYGGSCEPVMAHRFSYEKFVGPIPDGLVIDHKCKNPSCVNPSHLEPVTPAENQRRGRKTKLTKSDVAEIRRRFHEEKERQYVLAKEFRVRVQTIHMIVRGINWVIDMQTPN